MNTVDFDFNLFCSRYNSGNQSLKSLKNVSLKRLYLQRCGINNGDLQASALHEYIKKYMAALKYIKTQDVISNEVLFEVSRILELKGAGSFRDKQNWIGKSLATASYIPPKKEQIFDLMRVFIEDANSSILVSEEQVAAIFSRFLLIHPFLDGNGRIARILYDNLCDKLGLSPLNVALYRLAQYEEDFLVLVHSQSHYINRDNGFDKKYKEERCNNIFKWVKKIHVELLGIVDECKKLVLSNFSFLELNKEIEAILAMLINQPIVHSKIILNSPEFTIRSVELLLQKGLLSFKKIKSAKDDSVFVCEQFMGLHNQIENQIIKKGESKK